MRTGRWIMLLLICLVIQTTLLARYLPPALRPDVVLLLAIFALARLEPEESIGFCWCIGLARDLLSAGPLGQYALLYMLAAVGIVHARAILEMRSTLVQAAVAFIMYGLIEGIAAIVTAFATGNFLILSDSISLLLGALVTAGAAPLAIWGFGALSRWLGLHRRRWRPA